MISMEDCAPKPPTGFWAVDGHFSMPFIGIRWDCVRPVGFLVTQFLRFLQHAAAPSVLPAASGRRGTPSACFRPPRHAFRPPQVLLFEIGLARQDAGSAAARRLENLPTAALGCMIDGIQTVEGKSLCMPGGKRSNPITAGRKRTRRNRPLTAFALLLGSVAMGRAEGPCARCHPSEAAAFERSPMGRSVGPPSVFAEGRVTHKLSGSTITIHRDGSLLKHRLERSGVVAEYPIAYSVGAGIVGYSYMVRLGQYLFESPVSYYTQTQSWDLTPGYEAERHLDFTHQISSGCLFCHTGSVNLIGRTASQFGDPPFTPISCQRCHGSAAAHLQNPIAGSIVNPAKLAPSRRDSLCEQCHLEGEVRILNPGRDWWDFQVGQAAESVFVTYLRTAARGTLRAVSQSELLARSQCARQSGGRFWCGTCHNPHAGEQIRPKALRQVCLSCHGDLFAAGRHRAAAAECVSCHMPRLRPTNVAHSAITDHSIPRIAGAPQPEVGGANPEPKAWRDADPALVRRDLDLAYFDLAASTHAGPDLAAGLSDPFPVAPARKTGSCGTSRPGIRLAGTRRGGPGHPNVRPRVGSGTL